MEIEIIPTTEILQLYKKIRNKTERLCDPLMIEDYVVQPIVDVSPPKWHLGHTTWFFETFILNKYVESYKVFHPDYNFVFNSYYETIGARVIRTNRGNLTRPTVEEIYHYRKYVDEKMEDVLAKPVSEEMEKTLMLGLNHEQQHQELLLTDIKYILGNNPLFPAYSNICIEATTINFSSSFISIEAGLHQIGYEGDGFCFDNELSSHQVFLSKYQIADHLVSNGEFLEFIQDGGYRDFRFWHSEGLDWVKNNTISSPLYWHFIDAEWYCYRLNGLHKLDLNEPVTHVSYYEAAAYANWKGSRLPTEFEWETASDKFNWGQRWEWTESAYLPYPGFKKAEGAIGEYNGKFMINQMVLRGSSLATSKNHSRSTYRNFFHPHLRWQFTGIRLAK